MRMSKPTVVTLLEFALAIVLAVGVGLVVGDVVGVVAGWGAGCVIAALVGFALVLAYEKGDS
jgi:hypothetical protein